MLKTLKSIVNFFFSKQINTKIKKIKKNKKNKKQKKNNVYKNTKRIPYEYISVDKGDGILLIFFLIFWRKTQSEETKRESD